MKRSFILSIFIFSSTLMLVAQTTHEPKGVMRFLHKLGTLIDTMAVKGVDPHYITAPERPWQVIAKGNVNQSELRMKSTINSTTISTEMTGDLEWEPRIKSSLLSYAGIWAGYRGYGLGYSWNVSGGKGSILSFGATGGSYGINLRIHTFRSNKPEVHYEGAFLYENGQPIFITKTDQVQLASAIKTRTLLLDAYYLFNGKRFSYAAAYDQSVIQKRSAGSFMAGAMYYHSHINYVDDENAAFIMLMDDIGRIKQWQFSVGAGYAYNFVPCQGLLISAMFMPMLTIYDRHKTWRYDSNLREVIETAIQAEDELIMNEYHLNDEPLSITDGHSPVALNFDTRLSLTYQWSRFFINAYGQFSRFHFKDDGVKGTLRDWYINASIGVRF